MLSREQIEQFIELSERATPGEWVIAHGDDETADEIFVFDKESRHDEYPTYTTVAEELLAVDSRFIAQSRNLMPELARDWLRMRETLERIANGRTHYGGFAYDARQALIDAEGEETK